MSRISKNHKVYNISYHITWIPKYRKHILKEFIKKDLSILLKEKCKDMNIDLVIYEIMPDHIHLFIKSNPSLTISKIIKNLKGYTSYKLRNKYLFLKRYKSLWTSSYFCETIGLISEKTVRKYIEMQTIK